MVLRSYSGKYGGSSTFETQRMKLAPPPKRRPLKKKNKIYLDK